MKLRGQELWDFVTWTERYEGQELVNEPPADRVDRWVRLGLEGNLASPLIHSFRAWRSQFSPPPLKPSTSTKSNKNEL